MHKTLTLVGVAAMLACTAVLHAETDAVDRFAFTVANAPQDALTTDSRMRVTINRWSTDEEKQMLTDALKEPGQLLNAFRHVGAIGYLQWPGGLEYAVRYAKRTPRADGGADVVLVLERPVWLWWDENAKWQADQQFTVVQFHVGKDGTGEGRLAIGDGFTSDPQAGIVVTDRTKPALLTEVRRESVG